MKAGATMAGAAAAAAAAATTRRNFMRRSEGTEDRARALLRMSESMNAGRNPIVPVEIITEPAGVGSQFTVRMELLGGAPDDFLMEVVEELGRTRTGSTVYTVNYLGMVANGRVHGSQTRVEQTKLCVITSNRGMMVQQLGYPIDEPSPYFELTSPPQPQTHTNTPATPSDEDNNDMWSPALVLTVPRQVGDVFEIKMTLWSIPLEVEFKVMEDLGPQNGLHHFRVAILQDGAPGMVTDFKLLSPIAGRVLVVP